MEELTQVVRRLKDGERVLYQHNLGRWKPVRGEVPRSLVEESYQNYSLDPELAESDWIELNQHPYEVEAPITESTALLGTSAAAGSTGVSTTGIVGGIVGGVAATAAVGGVIAAISNSGEERKDPIATLPDHKFLGPGNDADDEEPLDIDDKIAKDHDHDYSKAKTQEDIQIADDIAIDKFVKDFQDTGNIHSAFGAVGLGIKRVKERVTGVKYPANLPSSSGMVKFPVNSDPRKQPDWRKRRSFQSDKAYNNWIKYTWAQWNRARASRGLPRVWPPSKITSKIGVTHRPPKGQSNEAIPFGQFVGSDDYDDSHIATLEDEDIVEINDEGPLLRAFAKARERVDNLEEAGLGHRVYNDPELNDLVENWDQLDMDVLMEYDEEQKHDGGQISSADFDDRDGAGPSGVETQGQNPIEEATPEEQDMSGRKRSGDAMGSQPKAAKVGGEAEAAAAPAAGTGHNSKSDGGFDSAQGPESYLPTGGYKVTPGKMVFQKVHRMKSWAIPYVPLGDDTYRDGADLITTPLMSLPVNRPYLYTTPEEFALIPAGSYIDSVHVDIMQTVATTGYPTGGTTASVATTNHPKVLVIGKDLEAKCRGGVDRVLSISNTMKPSLSTETDNADDFIAKQYGTTQGTAFNSIVVPGCAHKIPYYNRKHFMIYQPNATQATARGFISPENKFGFEYFQNMITEVNSNDTTWDTVHNYSYKFENAPIGAQFTAAEICTDAFDQSTGNALYYNATRKVTNVEPNAGVVITEAIGPSNEDQIPIVTYKSSPMEKGSHYVRGDKAGKPSRQPSFHIGMRSIDKMAPETDSSRATEFVQANIEFEILCTMIVNLPSYPNRFTRPGRYNVSIENAPAGIGIYPAFGIDRLVTFGLPNSVATPPPVTAVDQRNNEPTEDGTVVAPASVRVRRSLPRIVKTVKATK